MLAYFSKWFSLYKNQFYKMTLLVEWLGVKLWKNNIHGPELDAMGGYIVSHKRQFLTVVHFYITSECLDCYIEIYCLTEFLVDIREQIYFVLGYYNLFKISYCTDLVKKCFWVSPGPPGPFELQDIHYTSREKYSSFIHQPL